MKRFQFVTYLICLVAPASILSTQVYAEEVIKLGFFPSICFAQPAVIVGEGWDKELGITFELNKYPGPANMLQAFVSGEVDGMNNNMAAGILASARGIQVKFVTGTFIGDINFISEGELIILKNTFGQIEAIKRFYALQKRKLKLVTNPKGSLSDLTTRYWLKTNLPNFENYIEIVHAADQAQLLQLYLNGRADLLAGYAPLKQILSQKRPHVEYFLAPKELMEAQPGGALTMKSSFINTHPEEISKLKSLYDKATMLMKQDPERCAAHIEKYLLQGLLTKEVIAEALIESKDYLSTDLKQGKSNMQKIHTLMIEDNYIKEPIDLDSLF